MIQEQPLSDRLKTIYIDLHKLLEKKDDRVGFSKCTITIICEIKLWFICYYKYIKYVTTANSEHRTVNFDIVD